jgi:hypothetical protein
MRCQSSGNSAGSLTPPQKSPLLLLVFVCIPFLLSILERSTVDRLASRVQHQPREFTSVGESRQLDELWDS